MITVVTPELRDLHAAEIEQMHRLRHRVFKDRLKIRWFQARQLDIHLIGLYFHVFVGEMLKASSSLSSIELTTRERECLEWTSRGKTAWDISEILNIGESTVVSHLNNARDKFGVYSKHHAVVKAIMLGLILP